MNFDTYISTVTAVPTSATAVQITGQNDSRKGLYVVNDNPTNTLYFSIGVSSVTTANYSIKLLPGYCYEMPSGYFTLPIYGIWDGAMAGYARVTEISKGYF